MGSELESTLLFQKVTHDLVGLEVSLLDFFGDKEPREISNGGSTQKIRNYDDNKAIVYFIVQTNNGENEPSDSEYNFRKKMLNKHIRLDIYAVNSCISGLKKEIYNITEKHRYKVR